MKLFIYTTDIEAALRDDFAWSITLSSRDDLGDIGGNDWYLIGEIEYDINLDRKALTSEAISNLGKQIQEIRATTSVAITQLEGRQQNLLALNNGGES